jgi:hypothetical protein
VYLRATSGFSLVNNLLAGNAAAQGGGAALIGTGAMDTLDCVAANNTFSANSSEALWVTNWPTATLQFVNNLIAHHPTAIRINSPLSGTAPTAGQTVIDHTLLWDNKTDFTGSGAYTVTDSLSGEPAFVDPAGGDYHLLRSSPARDAGRGGSPAPDHDADGHARPFGPAWDIGAYEWQQQATFLPLVSRDVALIGWTAGQDRDGYGVILHTRDAGRTWTRQPPPSPPPFSVKMGGAGGGQVNGRIPFSTTSAVKSTAARWMKTTPGRWAGTIPSRALSSSAPATGARPGNARKYRPAPVPRNSAASKPLRRPPFSPWAAAG